MRKNQANSAILRKIYMKLALWNCSKLFGTRSIFIYHDLPDRLPIKLINLKLIWKETRRAEHEYMNVPPPPLPNLRSSGGPAHVVFTRTTTREQFSNTNTGKPV